jgi:VWFA-related protein
MAFMVVSCLIAGAVVLEGRSGIPQTFTAKTDLVALQVAVHDRKSSAVSNLGREAFRVFEDGLPQDIQFFISEDSPVAIGLVIDNSGSMWNKQQEVVAAAHAFARSSNPDDALFTVNFNERVWFGLPKTGRSHRTLRCCARRCPAFRREARRR